MPKTYLVNVVETVRYSVPVEAEDMWAAHVQAKAAIARPFHIKPREHITEADGMEAPLIVRYAYRNTLSEAGSPERYLIDTSQIVAAYVWVNSYGNPTYSFIMREGTTYLMVDDYGAMNDVNHLSARTVRRRKELL